VGTTWIISEEDEDGINATFAGATKAEEDDVGDSGMPGEEERTEHLMMDGFGHEKESCGL
jgi:hypothetical protein